MKLQIFAVWDCKAEAFSRPFFAQSKGAAIRSFQDAANDVSSEIGKHPEDYTLFHMGEFSDDLGSFGILPAPESLAAAITLVTRHDA
jgi:hypothetical protein